MADSPAERTALYRFYDEDDRLLYVGITSDTRGRFKQHASSKPWWSQVTTRELEWYPTREDAAVAEVVAIRAEHPMFNHQHSPSAALALLPPVQDDPMRPKLEPVIRDNRTADQRMASELRALIVAGELVAGDRLPTTSDLEDRFQLSNVTVQRGLRQLKLEGFAVGQNGRGVFVTSPSPAGMDGAAAATANQVSIAECAAPRRVGEILGTGGLPVLREESVLEVGGWPVCLITAYSGLVDEQTDGLTRIDRVSARMPTSSELIALNLPDNVPVLRTFRVHKNGEECAVRVEIRVEPAHLCQLVYEVPPADDAGS